MNEYMIPANSKKSQLILGFFTTLDLILFGSGCITTFLLLLILNDPGIGGVIIILLPALITGFLVLPVVNYHNILQLLTNIINFYKNRRRYYWKGWCTKDE